MCFQTCDLIAYCRVFYAAPEHCSNLCLNKCNNGSQVPIAFAIFALSTHPFKRHNLKSVPSIFILHQWTPRSDLLRFKAKTRFLCWMLSLASKTQAVFLLPCTSPCQQSRCWNQPFAGKFAGGAGRAKKNLLSGLHKFCYQKTEYVLSQTSILFAMGKPWCFWRCFGIVQVLCGERGTLGMAQALKAAVVLPQHPFTDAALLFKSKQRDTSLSV